VNREIFQRVEYRQRGVEPPICPAVQASETFCQSAAGGTIGAVRVRVCSRGLNDVSPTRDTLPDPDSGEARSLEHGLVRGDVIGRYIVLEKVGAGGMGVVYAAYDPDLDRRVALKIVQPKRQHSQESLGRMLREAKSLAQLAHPNVVAVHDVGEARGGVFLAMEFVRGQTLSRWRASKQPSWREVLAVMIAVGHGLAAAHDKGLVHRDIKPDNVMIDEEGRVRVMDFGLARPRTGERMVSPGDSVVLAAQQGAGGSPADAPEEITRDGAIIGTPSYMAPEQLGGAPIDAAADQFAYCITLWESVYGRRPFLGATFEAMSIAIAEGLVTPPPKGTKVTRWVHRILLRGLSPAPADRWPSMHALLAALVDDPRPRRVRRTTSRRSATTPARRRSSSGSRVVMRSRCRRRCTTSARPTKARAIAALRRLPMRARCRSPSRPTEATMPSSVRCAPRWRGCSSRATCPRPELAACGGTRVYAERRHGHAGLDARPRRSRGSHEHAINERVPPSPTFECSPRPSGTEVPCTGPPARGSGASSRRPAGSRAACRSARRRRC
jgi:serine/threonine protein kinase